MKKLKPTITTSFVFATVFAFASIAFASFETTSWQFYRNISAPNTSQFVKIVLPDTISRDANNFSDVRVMTTDSVEVPYIIVKDAVRRGGDISGRILDKTTAEEGSTQFIVDTNETGGIHTGMTIESRATNFRRQAKVYSSSTLIPLSDSKWNIVTDKGFLFRFTDPYTSFASGKNSINFTANTSRYLKVVIDSGTEGPVDVSSVRVYGETRIDIPSYKKEVTATTFNNPKRKTTEVTIDLGETGHVTDAITIKSTDKNYSRRVIIETTNNITDNSSWVSVGESSISNVSTSLFTGSSDRISYSEQKSRYIRVSIVNDDNRPIKISDTVTVEGPVVSAIFETRSDESYRLYYGNPLARPSTYDLARISSYIETNSLPQASIGEEINNPAYVAPKGPVVPYTESHKGLLNALLVFVVILMGGGIGWYLHKFMKNKIPHKME